MHQYLIETSEARKAWILIVRIGFFLSSRNMWSRRLLASGGARELFASVGRQSLSRFCRTRWDESLINTLEVVANRLRSTVHSVIRIDIAAGKWLLIFWRSCPLISPVAGISKLQLWRIPLHVCLYRRAMSRGGIRLHSLRSFHTVEHALKLCRNLFSLALASQSSLEARTS